jgi:predicted ATP-grasp superfamily ATP-dependent carboligase
MDTLVTHDQVACEVQATKRESLAGALLMGADYRALGVARSLGRRGIPVWIIKQGGHLVAINSRYVSRRLDWPERDDTQRVDFLMDLSERRGLKEWLLIPTDDYATTLTGCHHKMLANHYRLTSPPWDALRWGCDKRCLYSIAQRAAIAQPWTKGGVGREELAEMDCPFPVIVKPAVRMRPSSLHTPKAWFAADREALLAAFDHASHYVEANTLLIQEMVPGGGEAQFSYAALYKDGLGLASVVAKRTRQFPEDFGQFSTYVETVDDPGIVKPAERLLALMRFTGLVEVEFKRDPRDGQYKLLDFNPRVWGWHTLCGRAGVDFPYLLWLLMRDEPVPEVRARSGERWMHLSADLWVAAKEILHGRLSAWDYLRELLRERESAIFAWDDPLPGAFDLPLLAWSAGRRMLRG